MTASNPHPLVKRKSYLAFYARNIIIFFCLLITKSESSALTRNTSANAIDLLTTFSGEGAKQYQPYFRFSEQASIDIALWDLAARKAGRPLHQLLGSQRDSIEPYASLPFYYDK